MRNIAVFGAGYVGLVAGACLADAGNRVWCIDSNPERIAALQRGEIPIYEEGLAELVSRCARERRLRFCTEAQFALRAAEVVFVAVGTPSCSDGSADLSAVFEVARTVARQKRRPALLVLKSTVPVGTNAQVSTLLERLGAQDVEVVSNPEFLKEGAAIHDFRNPDRVVLGLRSEHARRVMSELYRPFLASAAPIFIMDPASAELSKYASNAMLATRISFMNAVAGLCESLGADVEQVRQVVGSDRRIGPAFLFAGAGFGGSCFPKDLRALLNTARNCGVQVGIWEEVERINERQKSRLLAKADKAFAPTGGLAGKTVALWGLAFKPKTDDLRESPALCLLQGLLERGARVLAHDPVAAQGIWQFFPEELESGQLRLSQNAYQAAAGADSLMIATEWPEYRQPDFRRLHGLLKRPWIFDGRNLWSRATLAAQGFSYFSIGRPDVHAPGQEQSRPAESRPVESRTADSSRADSRRGDSKAANSRAGDLQELDERGFNRAIPSSERFGNSRRKKEFGESSSDPRWKASPGPNSQSPSPAQHEAAACRAPSSSAQSNQTPRTSPGFLKRQHQGQPSRKSAPLPPVKG